MPKSVQIGDQLPSLTLHLDRAGVVRYAGAATDFNPIHFNDRAAQAAGLPMVVAHGMWTMGAALRIVTDWLGEDGQVVNYFVRFVHPLAVPDTDDGVKVEVNATITAIEDDLITISIDALHDAVKLLGAAKAQIRLTNPESAVV